jgi:hypothetical protein
MQKGYVFGPDQDVSHDSVQRCFLTVPDWGGPGVIKEKERSPRSLLACGARRW